MHRLLQRQLRRHFTWGTDVPPDLAAFLEDVERAYDDSDADRHLLERSIDLSSKELRDALATLGGLLQAHPDIIFRITEDGTILECRGGADEMLLRARHRLIGKRIQRLPDRRAGVMIAAGIAKSLATGALATVQYVLSRESNTRAYEARIVPIPGRQLVVLVRDVSEHFLTREAKSRQQAFVRDLVDLNPSLIGVKDGNERFIFANVALGRAYGTTVDGVLGRTEVELGRSLDEVASAHRHELHVVRTGSDAYVPEEPFTTRGGHTRWFQTIRRAIPGPDGDGPHVLAISADVSERLRAERDLRQRTERLQAQHNVLHDLVINEASDDRQQLERILAVAAQETGVERVSVWVIDDRARLARQHFYNRGELSAGKDLRFERSQCQRLLAAAMVSRTIATVDARLDMRTNELTADYLVPEGVTSLLIGPICQGGELIGLLCHEALNRPRRWTPEEEQFSASIADMLALSMAGASRRLLERQLLQSQKMESIGALAAGVAHDFNNLLSAIVGFADLTLKRMEPEAATRRSVEQIVKAAHRGGALTRQLLTFSRKQPMPPEILDLNHIVREMEPLLRRLIGEGIAINLDLDRCLGRVRGDAGQVEQVLLNLLVNARDAMPGGGTAWIETRNQPGTVLGAATPASGEARRSVVLTVRDTGVGMTPETQLRIFEPFFTTKAPSQGTGLGLSTVYGIVREMGGDIRVRSEPGAGTTFSVHLPEVDAPADVPQIESEERPRALRGSETILVVEDDEQLLTLTVESLAHHGYKVIGAASGIEALILSEQPDTRIDLIVVDIAMPFVNGPDLVASIRQVRPDLKVLFMSAVEGGPPLPFSAGDNGVEFIRKPFMPDDLVERIRRFLDGDALNESAVDLVGRQGPSAAGAAAAAGTVAAFIEDRHGQ